MDGAAGMGYLGARLPMSLSWRSRTLVAQRTALIGCVVSLDHLVGAGEERLWDRQSDRRRGPEIDDQFEVGGLVDGDVGGLLAFENPVHDLRGTSIPVGKAVPVGHEAALLRPFLADEHAGQALAQCELDDLFPGLQGERIL